MTPELPPEPEGHWWPAPAKLNLFLHVTGQRPDQYHTLQTLFQILDWGDEVNIRPTSKPTIVRRCADYAVPEGDDLVVQAAQLLRASTGCEFGAELEVRKQIPMGAGLGGGSSDAATVLLVLNRLWACNLSLDELAKLGLQLGADVPVFLCGNTAMAAGIGEQLEPVSLGERFYLLVLPPFQLSTAEVFSDIHLKRNSAAISVADALAGKGRNDCEAVARRLRPELSAVFTELANYGQPRMSGTGSAVFVEMCSAEAASSAASELKCRYNVRAVGGLDQSPLQKRLLQYSEI